MTNEEILLKAIQKAKDNGFKFWNVRPDFIKLDENSEIWEYKKDHRYYASVYKEIFNHDFAKAFWGSGPRTLEKGDGSFLPSWQYHLQQMVLEEDPIKYLEQFLTP